MLNGILAINKNEPELASRVILKLSDFLRYLLYDNNHNQVYLSAEVRFITDFLELEKMRRDNFTYEIRYDLSQPGGVKIPPHVLLTLVENAVKHSSDSVRPSCVELNLQLNGNRITVFCKNSVASETSKITTGGLGLVNMHRRLQLLFADKFELFVNKEVNFYTVNLSIPI